MSCISSLIMKGFLCAGAGTTEVSNMPQSKMRICRIVVLPVVAILALLVLCTLVVYFTRWARSDTNLIGSRANSTLRSVIVVTRHGSRSPLFTFPSNPYPANDSSIWPYGPKQLTRKGRAQLYNLGKLFRTLYNGFLDELYRPEEILAFSTATERTLMSAQAFLAGLFPPKGFQVWNDQLLWQPVPVFTTTLDHTEYFGKNLSKICPSFKQEANKLHKGFYQDNEAQLTEMFDYVRSQVGGNVTEPILLYDPIVCAEREGLPLPLWTKEIYPEPLTSLMDKSDYAFAGGSTQIIRLLQGQLYNEMVELMQAKANGTLSPDRKMFLYSCHDMTIRTLTAILGSNLGLVNTGTALVLELHRLPNSTSHFVEVVYIDGGSTPLVPKTITIPGCGTPCLLPALLKITEKYYNIADYNKECHTTYPNLK